MDEPTAPAAYHLFVLRDGQQVEYTTYPDRDGLVAALRAMTGNRGRLAERPRAYIFRGDRLLTTRPPFPYLIEAGQQPVPLFQPPAPGEACLEGELAEDESAPAPPAGGYDALTAQALVDAHTALGPDHDPDEPLAD